uniref:MFS domain-containing protein n=1 Tax=Rhabditophanes sp. KR3021 TaxID=114890 RepID=A0AC35U7D0_9BILA
MSNENSIYAITFKKRKRGKDEDQTDTGARLYHALIVIFLEYFVAGMLTIPAIHALAIAFPENKLLLNGVIIGCKGIFSFISAPSMGIFTDTFGRKPFLLCSVFCTCIPAVFLVASPHWYFALFTLSGISPSTFSVIVAFVADITHPEHRATAYGLISATFAASFVLSPAIGAAISSSYGDSYVVGVATVIFVADLIFVFFVVPETLPASSVKPFIMDNSFFHAMNPFSTLKNISQDREFLKMSFVVFFSNLSEAGQLSFFFLYLKVVDGFSDNTTSYFMGVVGSLSVLTQTYVLQKFNTNFGPKQTIAIALVFQFLQLIFFGFSTHIAAINAAGIMFAMSQMTYPAITAYVSINTDQDKQGTMQGLINGVRGLCQGIGPALFGFIFYTSGIDMDIDIKGAQGGGMFANLGFDALGSGVLTPEHNVSKAVSVHKSSLDIIPGPPFAVGAVLVFVAFLVVLTIKDVSASNRRHRALTNSLSSGEIPLLIEKEFD